MKAPRNEQAFVRQPRRLGRSVTGDGLGGVVEIVLMRIQPSAYIVTSIPW